MTQCENSEKKEYLNQYRKIKKELKNLEEQYEEIQLHEIMPSVNNSGMPSGHNKKDLSDYASKLDEVCQMYIRKRYDLINKHKEIFSQIEKIEDSDERIVLNMRYIGDKSWREIETEVKYSRAQIYRIHGSALEHFQLPYKGIKT